jgi:hypothetical protein
MHLRLVSLLVALSSTGCSLFSVESTRFNILLALPFCFHDSLHELFLLYILFSIVCYDYLSMRIGACNFVGDFADQAPNAGMNAHRHASHFLKAR